MGYNIRMESFTKIALTPQHASAILARHFGAGARLARFTELKEGLFNAAACLELDDGFRCVLKVAPPDHIPVLRYEKDILRAEVEALQFVRQATDLPVPQVYAHDTSHSLLESNYFLMEFIPGQPYHKFKESLPPQDRARVARQIGEIAHSLSLLAPPNGQAAAFGYWAQPEPPGVTWKDCFAHMLQGILQDGQDFPVALSLPYDQLWQRLLPWFEALEPVIQPRLVHWDLWDGNIFVDPGSLQVNGVIDFERVMWADPLIEVIYFELDPLSPAVQGFGEPQLELPGAVIRRHLYSTYLSLIMIIETFYRRFPTPDQLNWARAQLEHELAFFASQQ